VGWYYLSVPPYQIYVVVLLPRTLIEVASASASARPETRTVGATVAVRTVRYTATAAACNVTYLRGQNQGVKVAFN
jgi:hypothetical protein